VSAAAGRRIAVPDGVDWRRMHPVSPLLEGWKVVTAVIAVLTVRNVDNLVEAYRYATTHGIDLAHGVEPGLVETRAGVVVQEMGGHSQLPVCGCDEPHGLPSVAHQVYQPPPTKLPGPGSH